MEIVWPNVFGWIWVHVMGLYGSTLLLDMKLKTGLWLVMTLWMTAIVWTKDEDEDGLVLILCTYIGCDWWCP